MRPVSEMGEGGVKQFLHGRCQVKAVFEKRATTVEVDTFGNGLVEHLPFRLLKTTLTAKN